jgi:hypothetical protein
MRLRRGALAAIAVALAVAALRLGRWLATWGVDVWVWDQWDFLEPFFGHASLLELFRWQHGPHRMGLGLPLMLAVETWSGASATALGWLNLGLLALACGPALALLRRLSGRLEPADAIVPLACLGSAQWHALFGVPNASHGPLPLLLVLAFAWALACRPSWPRTAALVLVDLCAVYTGMGIWLGGLAPLALLAELRRPGERARALAGALACALVAASFLVGYETRPGPCLDGRLTATAWERMRFFALLFARAAGVTQPSALALALGGALAAAAGALALAPLASLVRADGRRSENALALLAAFSLVFAAATAVGRGCLGAPGALEARYVPYLLPALVLYLALDFAPRPAERREWTAARDGRRRWIACVVAGGPPARCQRELGVTVHPNPRDTRLGAKLSFLRARGLGFFAGARREQPEQAERQGDAPAGRE